MASMSAFSDNDPAASREWTLQDYLNIVLRRKWIILAATLLVFGGGTAYYLTRPPLYRSVATFTIESPDKGLDKLLGNVDWWYDSSSSTRSIDFYQALLTSQTYQEMVWHEIESDSVIQASGLPAEEIQELLQEGISITPTEFELVRFSVTTGEPHLSYAIAKIAVTAFKTRCRQIELEETRNIVDYVEKQKEISRDKLEEAERELQEFSRGSIGMVSGDDEGGLLKRFLDLEEQLIEVQAQRELAEANISAYDQRLRNLKAPSEPGLNEIDSPRVRELRAELDRLIEQRTARATAGRATAELDRQIEQVRGDLFQEMVSRSADGKSSSSLDQSLWDEIRQNRVKEELNLYMLKNRERYYQRLVQKYRQDNPRLVERAIEEARLRRSRTVYENLFNILLEKGEEARIKSATGTGGIRIIDQPTLPRQPIDPKIPRKLAMALFLGLGMGFGLALLREYTDNTIKSADEVEKMLGAPLLGSVPTIAAKSRSNGELSDKAMTAMYRSQLISTLKPRDPVGENYRTLRTNLQFANVDEEITSLLVTSSMPGEGKTLTSANLAIAFAELGKSVLLIDGDMRKPIQHQVFGVTRDPGLSDCAVRSLALEQAIRPTQTPKLKLMPAGTLPPNPVELIASQRMTDLLQQLQRIFDLLIIDSPPVGVVTDPLLWSTHVKNVLLVFRFAETNHKNGREALAALNRSKAHVLGVILNGVRLQRGYGYTYGYKYSHYYGSEKK